MRRCIMNKPIVKCRLLGDLKVGCSAHVLPFNHPNHLPEQHVANNQPVRTSTVVGINKSKKRFVTRHTIYEWE